MCLARSEWEITQTTPDSFTFTTDHEFAGQEPIRLVRTVTLANRTIRSETHLFNTGSDTVPVSWYP